MIHPPAFLPLLLALALAAPLAAQGTPPCFEPNFGTDLGLADDQVSPLQALGFAFPFGGANVTAIRVSSNGFIWLANDGDNGCCSGDPIAFRAGNPRIAPLWTDLDPSSSGAVHFTTFANRAVVTFDAVFEYGGGTGNTVQVQLIDDGSIVMFWDGAIAIDGHTTLVGITPGGGVPDPGQLDFSSALPFDSGSTPTIYQTFVPASFDLGGSVIAFTPNASGGYVVTHRTDCNFASFTSHGIGCPVPPSVYELFGFGALDLSGLAFEFTPATGGGYDVSQCSAGCIDPGYATGTNLGLGDDDLATNLALGFTFPYYGGSTTAVDVSSNGNVYLEPGAITSHRCCNGDPGQFLGEAASIAVLWQDLNPSIGGAVRTHQPNATTFVITFDAVPEYNATGSANTAQLQLFADGRFRLAFGTVGNVLHACLVGFTPGNGSGDPGSYDLSSATPFSTGGGGEPLTLFGSTGARPTLGSTFTMVVGHAPASALSSGLMIYGFTPNLSGLSLDPIGMSGCRLYLTPDATAPFTVQGNYSNVLQAIPSSSALLGLVVWLQAAIVAPGTNAAGIVISNAARMELGS